MGCKIENSLFKNDVRSYTNVQIDGSRMGRVWEKESRAGVVQRRGCEGQKRTSYVWEDPDQMSWNGRELVLGKRCTW